MSKSNWRNVLEEQQRDLNRLQTLDAELTEEVDDIDADVAKVLRSAKSSAKVASEKNAAAVRSTAVVVDSEVDHRMTGQDNMSEMTPAIGEAFGDESATASTMGENGTPKAPMATERYLKAKIRMLTQQNDEGTELRKKMSEQINDLQKQLKGEREESKKLRKRISILETENRRVNNMRKPEGSHVGSDPAALEQEVTALKKDLATAERIAKQADANSKNKDLQLKRATETISRIKTQLQETQSTQRESTSSDRQRVDTLEGRVKTLEKHRNDLIDAFRKQMKLIDVLKRQKVHIEAARLLNFTEEEFMKTLDWAV